MTQQLEKPNPVGVSVAHLAAVVNKTLLHLFVVAVERPHGVLLLLFATLALLAAEVEALLLTAEVG